MISERVELSEVQRLALPKSERVDIWLCRLEASANCIAAFQPLITSEERELASRFLSDRARNRFTVGRGVLRSLLAGYLSEPPSEVELVIEQFGKPRVAGDSICFNLAHSGDWLLLGFAMDNEVGVDIERHRPVAHERGIAERCFSPREIASFQAADVRLRQEQFFRLWTRKEAAVKWHGSGLQLLLSKIDVPLDEPRQGEITIVEEDRSCWVRSLDAPAGYSAALATTRPCAWMVQRELVLRQS